MRNLYANFRKYLASIGFCIAMVIQVACNGTPPEQGIQNFPTLPSQPLPTVIPPTQESPPLSYPDLMPTIPPGYPDPATEPEPIVIRPTFVPPPFCNIKPPNEITLSSSVADLNSLRFSEPVIIASTEHWFSSGQWLPDNQRLLFTEEDSAFETIFTLNIETGERVEYAKRHNLSGFPIWLNEPEGVMFVEATTEGWDLRFTDGQKTEILAKELASVYLEVIETFQK